LTLVSTTPAAVMSLCVTVIPNFKITVNMTIGQKQ